MTGTADELIGADQIEALEADIARLSDLEAIYRLRLTYYTHVNEGRFTALPALFTENAQVDFGNELGKYQGRDALSLALSALDERTFAKVLSHGHVADLDGDTAEGHLYIEGRLIVDGESFITMGKVTDRYRRAGGGWLIEQVNTQFYYAIPLHVGWADESDCLRPFTSP